MEINISWNVEAKIKYGKLDELKEWITKASSQVKKHEIGTLAYEFWLSPDKKYVHYYNRYLNSEALILHMNNISSMLPELLKLATPKKITVYGPANDSVKKIIKHLNPSYFNNYGGFTR